MAAVFGGAIRCAEEQISDSSETKFSLFFCMTVKLEEFELAKGAFPILLKFENIVESGAILSL